MKLTLCWQHWLIMIPLLSLPKPPSQQPPVASSHQLAKWCELAMYPQMKLKWEKLHEETLINTLYFADYLFILACFCSLVLPKRVYRHSLEKCDRRLLADCMTTLQYHRTHTETIMSITMNGMTPCLMMMMMMIWISQRLIKHC